MNANANTNDVKKIEAMMKVDSLNLDKNTKKKLTNKIENSANVNQINNVVNEAKNINKLNTELKKLNGLNKEKKEEFKNKLEEKNGTVTEILKEAKVENAKSNNEKKPGFFGTLFGKANNKPVNNKPVNNKPKANNKQANKPENNKANNTANNKPENNKPVNNKPANKPANNKPVNNKPANKPANNKPVNNKPVNNKPVNNKPVNNKPANNKQPAKKGFFAKMFETKPQTQKERNRIVLAKRLKQFSNVTRGERLTYLTRFNAGETMNSLFNNARALNAKRKSTKNANKSRRESEKLASKQAQQALAEKKR